MRSAHIDVGHNRAIISEKKKKFFIPFMQQILLIVITCLGVLIAGEPVHHVAIRAAQEGDISALSAALRNGVDPHLFHEETGHSALTTAAHHGQVTS